MSEILAARNLHELRQLLVGNGDVWWPAWTPEEIANILRVCEALWWYEKPISPDRPHSIMRNGNHTDFFADCMAALKETSVLTALTHQIHLRCMPYASRMSPNDWVVGAERAGAPIAQEMARLIGCRHATAEKDGDGNPTIFSRFEIAAGEQVLLVNDLLSHDNGSTYMSKVAVAQACPGAVIFPVAWHLVNRSGQSALTDGTPVMALLNFAAREMPADDCEYCQAGSPAMKFKPNRKLFLGSA
jgi:orotate phosphoribosyltransferase-like protein